MPSLRQFESRPQRTVRSFTREFLENLRRYHRGVDLYATEVDYYQSLALTVREYMMQNWLDSQHAQSRTGAKIVCYLSAEYLPGATTRERVAQCRSGGDRSGVIAKPGSRSQGIARDRSRAGAGQRRAGPVGGLLPRFAVHARYPRHWLRHSVQLRNLPPNLCERLADRATR